MLGRRRRQCLCFDTVYKSQDHTLVSVWYSFYFCHWSVGGIAVQMGCGARVHVSRLGGDWCEPRHMPSSCVEFVCSAHVGT